MKYRAEIDGLRAIAVVSVILYHAQFIIFGSDWFEGGFIGVDIFFVISGYLITRIILAELFDTGSFSFLQFYERRARRILPMLFAVILLSFVAARGYLFPAEFLEYSKSILSSVFFFSNFFFYQVTTEYGADSALLKPLLHTWSLAIEEQFYIIFPILLLIFHKFLAKHLLALLFIMLLFSLQIAELMDGRNPALNFFFSLSRFWELLVGAILAYFELKYGRIKHETLSNILPAFGLYLIIYAILFFDKTTPHPSFATLIPIIGVALVIAFSSGQDLVGKILGSKPLVAIGLISYSAYLWHFPIFAFRRIASNAVPSNYDKFEWILLTLILSIISYFLIEKPFRNKKRIPAKALWAILGAIALMIVGGAGYSIAKEGAVSNIRYDDKYLIDRDVFLGGEFRKLCHNKIKDFCYFKNENSSLDIVAIGDSHLGVLTQDLFYRIKDDFSYFYIIDGCPFILGVSLRHINGAMQPSCTKEVQQYKFDNIPKNPSIIILASSLANYFNGHWYKHVGRENLAKALRKTMDRLLNAGHHVIFMYPVPLTNWHDPTKNPPFTDVRKEAIKLNGRPLTKDMFTTSFDIYIEQTKTIFDTLDAIDHPNFHRVFPHKLLCDNQIKGRCVTHDGENLFYLDNNHVTLIVAKMINDRIIEKIELIKEKLEK